MICYNENTISYHPYHIEIYPNPTSLIRGDIRHDMLLDHESEHERQYEYQVRDTNFEYNPNNTEELLEIYPPYDYDDYNYQEEVLDDNDGYVQAMNSCNDNFYLSIPRCDICQEELQPWDGVRLTHKHPVYECCCCQTRYNNQFEAMKNDTHNFFYDPLTNTVSSK